MSKKNVPARRLADHDEGRHLSELSDEVRLALTEVPMPPGMVFRR